MTPLIVNPPEEAPANRYFWTEIAPQKFIEFWSKRVITARGKAPVATMRAVKKSPVDFALFVSSFASDKRPIARSPASNQVDMR